MKTPVQNNAKKGLPVYSVKGESDVLNKVIRIPSSGYDFPEESSNSLDAKMEQWEINIKRW